MADHAYRGATLPIFFPAAKDVAGAIVDLTGAAVSCSAQSGSGPEIPADAAWVTNGAAGLARAEFSAAQTAAFAHDGAYRYDGIAVLPSGKVVPLGYGTFIAKSLVSTP
jgi:hypothetical protein